MGLVILEWLVDRITCAFGHGEPVQQGDRIVCPRCRTELAPLGTAQTDVSGVASTPPIVADDLELS